MIGGGRALSRARSWRSMQSRTVFSGSLTWTRAPSLVMGFHPKNLKGATWTSRKSAGAESVRAVRDVD